MGRGPVPVEEQHYDLINANKEGLHQMSRHWGVSESHTSPAPRPPPSSRTTSNRWESGNKVIHLRQTEGTSSQHGVVSLRDRHVTCYNN